MQRFSNALLSISNKASLFESDQELNDFLKEAVSRLLENANAAIGGVFIYDDKSEELVFRSGYDRGDYWDSMRCCHGKEIPLRFSLDGNELGRAFRENSIRISSYTHEGETRSKIMVPILRGPHRIGVLMLARPGEDSFDDINKSDLKRAASLLGDMLAEATAFMDMDVPGINSVPIPESRIIQGLKASGGVTEGKALPVWSDMDTIVEQIEDTGDSEKELALFEKALSLSLEQLEQIQKSTSFTDTEMISLIFTAQLYMLKDENLQNKIRNEIGEGASAPNAVKSVINSYAERFSAMTEVRLAEKAQDVRDMGYRLLSNMTESEGFSYSGQIVLSRHIYPSDLFRLAVEGVAGLVLRGAGVTAHISILARSLSIPVIITDDKSLLDIPEGLPLLLDADSGKLYTRPNGKTRDSVLKKRKTQAIPGSYTLKGHLADGVPVSVHANINILKDAEDAVREGAEGIGLYRSEFPFILKNDFLSEEQQYRLYRSIVESQGRKNVTLRTADIGGDKLLQGRSASESNPFLGVRGIRFSLANREMFRDQLRAMLRAGYGANIGIMLPMVSGVEEVLQAREELDICREQLKARGEQFNSQPRLGAMVELPSAAMAVRELAEVTDFLSIGSNDLTMYLLAVDRTNENLSHLYRSHHPIVLRVLSQIAREAAANNCPLSICGDIASDPFLIPVLAGMGIRKLSVSPLMVDSVKKRLEQFSREEAEKISREVLAIRRLDDMDAYMKNFSETFPLPEGF